MKEFLAGRSNDEKVTAPEDKETREVVAAELLAAMAGASETSPAKPEAAIDTQEIPRFDPEGGMVQGPSEANNQASPTVAGSLVNKHSENPQHDQEQERARQLFLEHGYFDETVQSLRAASSPEGRAAAARALGLVGSQRAIPHLIAAMFDHDAEVREAASEALTQIGEPVGDNASAAPVVVDEIERVASIQSTTVAVSEPDEMVARPIETAEATIESSSILVEVEAATPVGASAQTESPDLLAVVTPNVSPDLVAVTSAATEEDSQLLLEEEMIRQTVAELEQQILTILASYKDSENEVRWRTEREAKLRAEAAARQLEEEETRKRMAAEAEARRVQEREAVAAEQSARLNAEAEAQRHADEETNLRLKAATLRLEAAEVARRRADLEVARQLALEAERQAEATHARNEARSQHETELEQLRTEEAGLQQASAEVLLQQTNLKAARDKAASEIEQLKQEQLAVEIAQRAEAERRRREAKEKNNEAEEQLRLALEDLRQVEDDIARRQTEVDAAREKADAEAQRLVEAQARMKAAEEARAQAEKERAQLEANINEQVEKELRLLEETRVRGEQEQERLKEELRARTEKEQQRLAEMELLKTKAEVESKERADKERQTRSQIESLRFADSETRRRIEDAEVKRRTAQEAYRLIAEQVQRVEAEAHRRKNEEERMLQKLESERRNAAIDAQSRAEQEKRIREEIEMFRRLEEEERPRIEAATLQLAEAEARLQERKERLKEDADARVLAEEELTTFVKHEARVDDGAATHLQEPMREEMLPLSAQEPARAVPRLSIVSSAATVTNQGAEATVEDLPSGDELAASAVTPAIATYLSSVDPYKRAAAVTELARSGSPDAFDRITECFEDHSAHVRNAAARALSKLEPEKAVDLFNRALEGASEERRRNIGTAIAASGLATEAINNLASESREDTYSALSILFVMAKTGEVEPLVQALEDHRDDEIGKAVSKLLTLSGHRVGEAADGGTRSS